MAYFVAKCVHCGVNRNIWASETFGPAKYFSSWEKCIIQVGSNKGENIIWDYCSILLELGRASGGNEQN